MYTLMRRHAYRSIRIRTVFGVLSPTSHLLSCIPPPPFVLFLLVGCLGAHDCRASNNHETAVQAKTVEEGAYCYLGYLPGTISVSYRCLVERLPELLRLVQAAHRVGQASVTNLTSPTRSMGRDALEIARKHRLRLAVERSADTFAAALEAIDQRMGESRRLGLASFRPAPFVSRCPSRTDLDQRDQIYNDLDRLDPLVPNLPL